MEIIVATMTKIAQPTMPGTMSVERRRPRGGAFGRRVLRSRLVAQPDMVSVQLNEEFVNREDCDATTLKDCYKIDFLYFMEIGGL